MVEVQDADGKIRIRKHADKRLDGHASTKEMRELSHQRVEDRKSGKKRKQPWERTPEQQKQVEYMRQYGEKHKEHYATIYPTEHISRICDKMGFPPETKKAMIMDGMLLDKRLEDLKKTTTKDKRNKPPE